MINIHITQGSKKRLYAEIDEKINGIKELKSVQTKNSLMSAAFSMSAIKFVKDTNRLSRSLKKSFHHIYEWNGVGQESSRLFRVIKKQETGGSASIYYRFNNSKKKSPIAEALKIPGTSGKVVSTSGVFKRKAEVMESGESVNFTTSRYIAFSPKGGGIVFVPPGKSISIRNPGGKAVPGSFEKHFRTWWNLHFSTILDQSGVINKLEKNVARTLNKRGAGRNEVRAEVKKTLAPYTKIGNII